MRYLLTLLLSGCLVVSAQDTYWQQEVDYKMDIDFDVETHTFEGIQNLTYKNNSPDTLNKVFYHLFFNAFQPNSMMDVRSRNLPDPDPRVKSRIFGLDDSQIGYLKIKSLKKNNQKLSYEEAGTILEVELDKPILPGEEVKFDMEFEGQVPVQIRRSGRDNAEGISYTMTQWYPKFCEYDREGWHAHPYIAREFHGVWGDFDVTIHIDSSYVIGGSGILQNPQEIGHGYTKEGQSVNRPSEEKLHWNFKAQKVHDFAWAADPDYAHDQIEVPGGPVVHFFYQPENENITKNWKELQPYASRLFQIMDSTFGKYPYESYSVIQGGDGGMEYPMCTMITGKRSLRSLVGVTVHEGIHSWYQGVLASNEAKYPWMDEGYTSFASSYVMSKLFGSKNRNPYMGNYNGYARLVQAGLEEPSSTHSDHYQTNYAYGTAAYSKGAISLNQLSYVIGQEAFFKGMKRYFNTWKFKHPEPRDFKRIMEKTSGLELDWYYEHWIHSTNTIDYAIEGASADKGETKILLKRMGRMPMPLDVVITYKDGSQEVFNIPLRIMRGNKTESFYGDSKMTVAAAWPWTHPEYELVVKAKLKKIESINIDPSLRMADLNQKNNIYPQPVEDESREGE